jgi:hypothetical protein
MSNEMYASCQVWAGTFDSELYVSVGNVSALVDKSNVKLDSLSPSNGTRVSGSVLVYIVEEQPNRVLVEIPGQAVVGGLRTWVPRDVLAAA